jgi:hypothetical protein
MTDTMRTLSALATLLADNETGAINPQDIRDAILATVQPGYAEMSVTASAATTHADTSTWSEVAGTWALTDASDHWAMAVNGRLNYTGAAVREVNISAAISMTAAGVNVVTEWAIGIDGVPLTPSIIRRKISTGADVGAAAVFGHADISPGSYISLMCRNITSATATTADLSNVVVTDFAA